MPLLASSVAKPVRGTFEHRLIQHPRPSRSRPESPQASDNDVENRQQGIGLDLA